MNDTHQGDRAMTRRQSIRWMGAVAASLAMPGFSGNIAGASGVLGYGTDPGLIRPERQVWPRILDARQVHAVSLLVDRVLPATAGFPAASELGVTQFFEEWLSAPYPVQLQDRVMLVPLIDRWHDAKDREILINGQAWDRFRLLTGSAYYTTPLGMRQMGFVGNVPQREFTGPPADVLRLLDERYDALQ